MKHVVVTGASSGIGYELCQQLEARGDRVHRVSRHDGVDISNQSSVDEFVVNLSYQLEDGLLDVLINNVGISAPPASLASQSWSLVQQTMAVSFMGPLYLTKQLLDVCLLAKGSIIYNVLSNNLRWHPKNYLPYNCAKAALQEMGMTLAAELKPHGISVGQLILGCVDTPGFRAVKEKDRTLESLQTLSTQVVAEYILATIGLMAFPSASPWSFVLDLE